MAEDNEQHSSKLTYWILGAIIAAFALAWLAPEFAEKFEIGGEVFLRLLKMIVVPLVFTSVMSGILGLGDVRKLGKPGAAAVGYYVCTTIFAVLIGLVVVSIIQPGVGVDQSLMEEYKGSPGDTPRKKVTKALTDLTGLSEDEVSSVFGELPEGEQEKPSIGTIFKNLALMLVTDNLFVAAAETQLLPIIVFAIIFSAMLTTMDGVSAITDLAQQANEALMKFVLLLMNVAPLGIFCLVTARFGKAVASGKFFAELSQIAWYFGTVVIALGIHMFVVLPLIYYLVRKENPYKYMGYMSKALLTAFSTASSSASLPVSMECTEEAGVSKQSSEFVLPLGATINMDGTALYEAVAAIFIAQAIGIELTMLEMGTIAITATLAAIGAAGIPEAGLVTLLIVLNAVNLPVEYVGLILTVDWLLDRFRTTVNVFGDSVGAAVVEKTLPDSQG